MQQSGVVADVTCLVLVRSGFVGKEKENKEISYKAV
jgi:hypothetical protein